MLTSNQSFPTALQGLHCSEASIVTMAVRQFLHRDALVQQEITAKVAAPSDADVADWYKANQSRVQGATLEQVSAPIRALLTQERTAAARSAYVDRLKASTAVAITLDPPRVAVSDGGRPAKGPSPSGGPPSTITRVGSPSVWESMTRTALNPWRPARRRTRPGTS